MSLANIALIRKINSIAEKILISNSIQETTESILENLKSELNAFAGVIFLNDPEKKQIYAYAHTKDKVIDHANKILRRDPFSISFSLKDKRPLLVKSFLNNKILIGKKLAGYFAPIINRMTLEVIQNFLGIKFCLCAPIRINHKSVGCLFMVFKRDVLDEREMALIQLYANMSGVALENHRNIEKLRVQYESEKQASAILTHELKTPISIAYSSSELLGLTLEKYRNSFKPEFVEKIRQQQLEIQESILRMNMICNSIFSMTEVENHLSLENQKLNLHQDLDKMVQVYKKYSQKGLKFNYYEKICSGTFYGPSVQFQQVVSIILENAFKYTKEGGVEMDLEMDGKQIICQITDTGPGISDDEKKKVFERFFRSSNTDKLKKQRGLGLGLYIAKKITDKLKGTLELVDNPKGQGSRFIIKFPVYKKK